MEIIYHEGKANVVAVALSRKSVHSLCIALSLMKWKDEVTKMGIHMIRKGDAIGRVMRFGKRGKLGQKFIGPYEILDRIGEVAYQLALPLALDRVHDVFHVSQLRKYVSDLSHVLEVENSKLDEALTYVEMPKEILDRKVPKIWNGETTLLKVLWSNHNVEEATLEPEEAIRERYSHLFDRVCLVTGS
ncbi:uncharacterized protein LOC141617138 [Silene latifolia]|uniref:uncharacterized protein LOC141617138 n=1 Tax=Silene latifolia TaxID=37657 RepID=UPI003D78307A